MRPEKPTALDIIWLSCRQLFHRMSFWIRPNFWFVLLSIPLVTLPAGSAALYAAVAAGLRDPEESRTELAGLFKGAFFKQFRRSLVLGITNLLTFALILFSIYFWVSRPERTLNYVSIISFYFLAMWFLCQPYLLPILVEKPALTIPRIIQQALVLVIRHPLFSFSIAITNLAFAIIGTALLGPILLLIPALIGLNSMQAYWFLTGQPIPDWMNTATYQEMLSAKEAGSGQTPS